MDDFYQNGYSLPITGYVEDLGLLTMTRMILVIQSFNRIKKKENEFGKELFDEILLEATIIIKEIFKDCMYFFIIC